MIAFAKSVTRIVAVMRKELRELVRRPGAIVSLMFGPLIVVALFGLGFSGQRRPFDTVIMAPAGSALPSDLEFYRRIQGDALYVVAVTEDSARAHDMLRRGEARMVISLPTDLRARLEHGEQARVRIEWNEMDPVEANVANVTAVAIIHELNTQLLKTGAQALGVENVTIGSPGVKIPPEVLASPLGLEARNLAPVRPSVVVYFGPAVLALVLQHLAITLTALSMVRERTSGAMDIFRVAPVHALELLVGKYLAHGVLTVVVAAFVIALMTTLLGVPLVAGPGAIVLLVLLLTFASLGVGLLISLIADSERQAVQLAMLVLLAAMFFSGFVLPIDEFHYPVRLVAFALPVTYAVRLLQDLMLKGGGSPAWYPAALFAIGAFLFFVTVLRLRGAMRAA